MQPTLRDGQVVVVRRRLPAINDIVVAHHPVTGELIIKRLTRIDGGGCWLEGDAHRPETAATSSDSWTFGDVPLSNIIGVATKFL